MKTASAEFLARLATGTTTLCRLVRITPRGRDTLYFTDHDKDVTYASQVYSASGTIDVSAIENSIGGARTNFDLSALLGGDITRNDVERGIYDGASVEVDAIFFDHVDEGVMPLAVAEIADIALPHKDLAQFGVIGLVTLTSRKLTEEYSATCRADFCDERCSLNIEDYNEDFTVDSITGLVGFSASEVAAHANGYYDLGTVTWLTGNNMGLSTEVRRSLATGLVELMIIPAYPIEVGDTGSIARGCDKTLAMCTLYDNILNFRGEPYVPGADFVKAPTAALDGPAAEPPDPIDPGGFQPWVGYS